MATTSTRKVRATRPGRPSSIPSPHPTAGKKKPKPSSKKKRTLHLAEIPLASLSAIERGMEEFSIGHITKATCRILEDYWDKVDRMRKAEEQNRRMRATLEQLAAQHLAIDKAKAGMQEVLLKFYDEY